MRRGAYEAKPLPEIIQQCFSLDFYAKCASWGLEEWASALKVRSAFVYALDKKFGGTRVMRSPHKFMREAADIWINDPIGVSDGDWTLPRIAVKDLTTSDVEYIVNTIESSDLEFFNNTVVWDLLRKLNPSTKKAYLAVDLALPDKIIEEKFAKWLKETRDLIRVKEDGWGRYKFNQEVFDDWHRQRLLPYLDLAFWNKLNGEPLGDDDIGGLIFKDTSRSIKDRLRTTKKNALAIISPENIKAMEFELQRSLSGS